jgi:hypothetical protein
VDEEEMSSEWKDKYFEEKFKGVSQSIGTVLEKVKENTDLTKEVKANGEKNTERIAAIEAEVFQKPREKDLPEWYKDPKVIQIILSVTFIIAGVLSLFLGIDLKGVLG